MGPQTTGLWYRNPTRYHKQMQFLLGTQALTKAISQGLSAEGAGKTPIVQSLCRRGMSIYLTSYCLMDCPTSNLADI